MNKNDFESKISKYIEGELSKVERIKFEDAMNSNRSFNDMYDDILHNDKLLKNLPQVKTSSNFMLGLNKKIDDYKQSKSNSWYNTLQSFIENIKPAPAFTVACVALVTCFSIIKISGFDLFPNFFSSPKYEHSVNLNNYIAINDSDSLSSNNVDSLKIGND